MKLTELVEVVGILAKYPDQDFYMTAEHDEVWIGCWRPDISEEDQKRLEALRWTFDFDGAALHRNV